MGWPRWLYSAALYGLAPLIWRRVWRESLLTHPRRQRLGWIPPSPPGERVTWLHCASLGEVVAARPLIEALARPGERLVITTMTATGAQRALALAEQLTEAGRGRVGHVFLPLDFPGAARRFVSRLRPSRALFFETELWPNLLATCHRRGVPVAVLNGRLSPRAFHGYRRLRPLMHEALSSVDWLAAKSAADAERFRALGMAAERTSIVGSLKFDIRPDEALREASRRLRTRLGERPVWVAGSTHEGEDEQLLGAHARLREQYPQALLILVPRHPQRFDAVAELCERRGLSTARRSREEAVDGETAVYLGDTLGELMTLYAAGDLAFVGGSLVPVGGHNLLEPAALGVPVLSGPALANFEEVAEVLREAEALEEVADGTALAERLAALFADEPRRQRLGEAGRRVVAANRGALARTLEGLAKPPFQSQ
ncbi:lipid IV(A) 3-deoxy-D-manno-octulosonic acid transferase [Halomonas pacifica]|uniref:3-deoxy-D-manno-octulosonic acid transferase n=1 Tax=Bisbaumannia pacifica TaxID=77098 RepID=A0A510X8V7_9GAMM|nr:lipid IV(A) 3-deoxy-D-manno-octulosonic acid transferase [Halomonas pacifica]MDC8804679.1 lipid IV(A) 3-deoxy-D-manno-octulosonic acid transferase [Halomonas pacifica]GEK47878.1 3-deoxy-D-manno-octulosonic acid transferase [Halomonas pacifica]